MACGRGLLLISLVLASLQVFLMEHAHSMGTISELRHSSSRRLKGIPAAVGKASVITVDKKKGGGDFTTVQDAINAVPTGNKDPVTINVKPGIYRSVFNETMSASLIHDFG